MYTHRIIDVVTGVKPSELRFTSEEEAKRWLESYGVSQRYKDEHYRIIEEGRSFRPVFYCVLALIGLSLAAVIAQGQELAKVELPDAPVIPHTNAVIRSRPAVPVHRPWMTRLEMVDAGAIIVTRTLDYVSTEGFLSRGVPEGELPSGLVHSKPEFFFYSEGVAAGEILAEHYFDRSRLAKHRVARIAARAGIEASIALLARDDWKDFHAEAPRTQPLKIGFKPIIR